MDTKAFDVQVGETSILYYGSNIKEEIESDDAGDSKMDKNTALICWGGFKEEPYTMVNDKDNCVMNVYETSSTKSIKEEDTKTSIDETYISIDNIKQEHGEIVYPYCKDCKREYQGYCSTCSKVTHILHNSILATTDDRLKKTLPINILDVRFTIGGVGVFALKTIPEGVIFGPFEDSPSTQSINGAMWKTKDGKISGTQNGNWMQIVNCTKDDCFINLESFQYKNDLYFRSIREINTNEELLMSLSEEHVNNANNIKETYYCPQKEEEFGKVYACTFCCLGFKSDVYLIEHKMQCPYSSRKFTVEEITQCSLCNIFLVQEEDLQHHMSYCSERHTRRDPLALETNQVEATLTASHEGSDMDFSNQNEHKSDVTFLSPKVHKKHKNISNIKIGVETDYSELQPFKCITCLRRYTHMSNAKVHIRDKHHLHLEKDYKCDQCAYQTNHKQRMKMHLSVHANRLSDKKYKCGSCDFQTRYKNSLQIHQVTHAYPTSDKKYKCHTCKFQTNFKHVIQKHQLAHSSLSKKKYKCDRCEFQTQFKWSIEVHLFAHSLPQQAVHNTP